MTRPTIGLMTVHQVATLLTVSPMTVYRLIRQGELRAHHIGRSYRIHPRDFAEYMRGSVTVEGAR